MLSRWLTRLSGQYHCRHPRFNKSKRAACDSKGMEAKDCEATLSLQTQQTRKRSRSCIQLMQYQYWRARAMRIFACDFVANQKQTSQNSRLRSTCRRQGKEPASRSCTSHLSRHACCWHEIHRRANHGGNCGPSQDAKTAKVLRMSVGSL